MESPSYKFVPIGTKLATSYSPVTATQGSRAIDTVLTSLRSDVMSLKRRAPVDSLNNVVIPQTLADALLAWGTEPGSQFLVVTDDQVKRPSGTLEADLSGVCACLADALTTNKDVCAAAFFCGQHSPAEKSPKAMLRALLLQLFKFTGDVLVPRGLPKSPELAEGIERGIVSTMIKLLAAMLQVPLYDRKLYIIIDAADVYDRDDLMEIDRKAMDTLLSYLWIFCRQHANGIRDGGGLKVLLTNATPRQMQTFSQGAVQVVPWADGDTTRADAIWGQIASANPPPEI